MMENIVLRFFEDDRKAEEKDKSEKIAEILSGEPLCRLTLKTASVLGDHLAHLAFDISRNRPDLEGKTLEVSLNFPGRDQAACPPSLEAFYGKEMVGKKAVRAQTLNIAAIQRLLVEKMPALCEKDILFAMAPAERR